MITQVTLIWRAMAIRLSRLQKAENKNLRVAQKTEGYPTLLVGS